MPRSDLAHRACLGVILLVAGCMSIDDPVAVARVNLGASPTRLTVGDSTQFAATPVDVNGRALRDVHVAWASSALEVLQVNQVTGKGHALAAGEVTVFAMARGRTAQTAIAVVQAARTP